MPRLVLILLGVLLLAVGVWFSYRVIRTDRPSKDSTGEVLQKTFPPEIVFSRAFWRSPSPGDRILHALRREWSDDQGVTRWQAFLAIEPGPVLSEWLASNPFSLATAPSITCEIHDPPSWFPKKLNGFTIQQSPLGSMVLLTAPGGSPVYLTDHGQGFARPAATPVPAASAPAPVNRLPNAPPPKPDS